MGRLRATLLLFACSLLPGCATGGPAGGPAPELDLARAAASGGLTLVNRAATPLEEGSYRGVRLDEKEGEGLAWIGGVRLADGVIELDVRGRDVLQGSFLGVAFHGVDDTTFDSVYLRPFNFRAEDPVRRNHAVQYTSHPAYPWPRLRKEHPEQYEKPVVPAPAATDWVHLRIVIEKPRVSVWAGDGAEPDLVVDLLSSQGDGRVGLWVGTGSPGDFANLKITPRG